MDGELEIDSEASALLRILELGKAEIAAGEYQLASEYFTEQKRLRSTRRRFESAPASDRR